MNCQDENDRKSFIQSFLACSLWASMDESTPQGGVSMDSNYTVNDFATEAKTNVETACNAFMDANEANLKDYPAGDAGHDFFLTSGHHGCGFWENDFGTKEQCDSLTKAAHAVGEFSLYVGDDGKIHV